MRNRNVIAHWGEWRWWSLKKTISQHLEYDDINRTTARCTKQLQNRQQVLINPVDDKTSVIISFGCVPKLSQGGLTSKWFPWEVASSLLPNCSWQSAEENCSIESKKSQGVKLKKWTCGNVKKKKNKKELHRWLPKLH